jgi:DNA modification methylase
MTGKQEVIQKNLSEKLAHCDMEPNLLNNIFHKNIQKEIPKRAKDPRIIRQIDNLQRRFPTTHRLILGDSRDLLNFVEKESVHLIVTSPPYWILKHYDPIEGQLGVIDDYDEFLFELNKVWKNCYEALVPGGRMAIVVGDVCLARRKYGRHQVVPLHADIQVNCRKIGFENLAPIIWYKIANVSLEVERGRFLGKPYEPDAIVKNDIEYILFERKPGYRVPTEVERKLSVIPADKQKEWFQQIWTLRGESTKNHPAPFPLELAERLIRMFSFIDDTILDPFAGTGTTSIASMRWGRNSIAVEIDPKFFEFSKRRMQNEASNLYGNIKVQWEIKQGLR